MVVAGIVDPAILEPVIQYEITAEQVNSRRVSGDEIT